MRRTGIIRPAGRLATAGLAGEALVAPAATPAMNRLLPASAVLSVAGGLLLLQAVLAAPVLAAPVLAAPPLASEAPGASESAPPSTDPQGTIVVDPAFITSTPERGVLGATGRSDATLPPTDAAMPASVPAEPFGAVLATLAAVSFTMLIVGRVPDVRRP